MKSLYVDGDTLLHRLSPRIKLGGLAVVSLLLFLTRCPLLLTFALLAGAGAHAWLGLGLAQTWRRLRMFLLTITAVAAFTLIFDGADEALVAFLRLASLALLAATVTATTTTSDFIDVVTDAARPLERLGIGKAADIGLAIGLVIRFVPDVFSRYEAIRDAHTARGLKVRPLTLAVPLIIITLRHADEIAAAIDARGIRGQ